MSISLAEQLALRAEQLRVQIAPEALPASTAECEPLERVAGQERALEAIAFGLKVDADGYNIVVAGPPASGKNTAARLMVEAVAAIRPPVQDWCYLYNFRDPYRPRAVALPPGLGDDLRHDLAELVDLCRTEIHKAFDSESYQERRSQVLEPLGKEREQILEAMQRSADQLNFTISVTPMGFVATPRGQDGRPLSPEVLSSLPTDLQETIQRRGEKVQEIIGATVRQLRQIDVRAREAIAALDNEVGRFVIGPILEELRTAYGKLGLSEHFDAIEADILTNLDHYRRFTEEAVNKIPPQVLAQVTEEREQLLKRYTVNLFVTHGDQAPAHAPVVVERQPTYANLFGRLDYQARFGSMMTDFTLIRPGAIHLANGGYLILQAQDALADARCWLKLKHCLKSKEACVGDIAEGLLPLPTVNLIPEAIALDLKVVLVGPPLLFALLDAFDPDFSMLFKVRAEFEPDTEWNDASTAAYASFVRRAVDTCALRHFSNDALVEILRYGTRLAARQDRLSTRYGAVTDLCEEANQIAADERAEQVQARHVLAALVGQAERSGLVPDRLRRMIAEGTLHVETAGAVVGQVNGLAVYQIGNRAFGTPTRITCRVGLGRRGVVNIEREVERSGAIHTKGVLVLSGYLAGTFGRLRPLAFTASITFEQSYHEVDGDSASSAELYAILASLARVPIRQDIAVTGSVDQFGNIQPVGGVTEKVEGFFDVCSEIGLTGSQGVIIPATNVINLTLRDDVAQAVAEGRFHLWAISRMEEGLELLTGVPAGVPTEDGAYPEGTIFHKVAAALDEMVKLSAPPLSADGRES